MWHSSKFSLNQPIDGDLVPYSVESFHDTGPWTQHDMIDMMWTANHEQSPFLQDIGGVNCC